MPEYPLDVSVGHSTPSIEVQIAIVHVKVTFMVLSKVLFLTLKDVRQMSPGYLLHFLILSSMGLKCSIDMVPRLNFVHSPTGIV